MTTDEAFKMLINTRGIYQSLNCTESQLRMMRKRFNDKPESVSLEKKISMLQHAGWLLETELSWKAK